MTSLPDPGAQSPPPADCGWCGGPTQPPVGVYLELLAEGRSMCVGCGRFTVHCECPLPPSVRFSVDRRREEGGWPF